MTKGTDEQPEEGNVLPIRRGLRTQVFRDFLMGAPWYRQDYLLPQFPEPAAPQHGGGAKGSKLLIKACFLGKQPPPRVPPRVTSYAKEIPRP